MGWTIFGVIWAFAILGITLNAIDLKKFKAFSMICYLCMGWCIIVKIGVVLKELGTIVSFVDRLGMYFSVIYYILTSVIMSSKKIPKPLIIIIIMIIFWDWYQIYVLGGGGDVYPYKSRILNI